MQHPTACTAAVYYDTFGRPAVNRAAVEPEANKWSRSIKVCLSSRSATGDSINYAYVVCVRRQRALMRTQPAVYTAQTPLVRNQRGLSL